MKNKTVIQYRGEDFQGASYRIGGTALAVEVSLLPGRKKPQLLLATKDGAELRPLATFANENCAGEFMVFMDRVLNLLDWEERSKDYERWTF